MFPCWRRSLKVFLSNVAFTSDQHIVVCEIERDTTICEQSKIRQKNMSNTVNYLLYQPFIVALCNLCVSDLLHTYCCFFTFCSTYVGYLSFCFQVCMTLAHHHYTLYFCLHQYIHHCTCVLFLYLHWCLLLLIQQ